MRLHSPRFEGTLRRGVRHALRASGELRRQYRAARRFNRAINMARFLRPALSAAFGAVVWHVADATRHPATALGAVTLWAFAFVFLHSQGLLARLYAASDLPALVLLPAAERLIFQWEWHKFLRGTLMSLVDLLAGYAVVAGVFDCSAAQWVVALFLAMAAWLVTLALANCAVAYLPRLPYALISQSILLVLFVVFVARPLVGDVLLKVFDNSAPMLNLLLPTGWPAAVFHRVLLRQDWLALGWLLPVAALMRSLGMARSRLHQRYQYQEGTYAEAPDLVPGAATEELPADDAPPGSPPRVGPTAIEEIVQSRQFLVEPGELQRGWLERMLRRWLTRRERALADFVYPNGFAATLAWKRVWRNLVVTCLVAGLAGLLAPSFRGWTLGIGLFVCACQAVNQLWGSGRAFETTFSSGVSIPRYATYGIGYRELTRFLLKTSFIHFPLLAPFAVLGGGLVAVLAEGQFVDGLLPGLKAAWLLVAARPALAAFSFSSGTNDSSGRRLQSAFLVLLMVGSGAAFLGLAAAGLFLPWQSAAALCCLLAPLEGYTFFRLYGWFYHANRFDLLRLPQR